MRYILIFISCLFIFNCENKKSESDTSFILIPRNSYSIDSYNGLSLYKLNETKKPMNGYFVVGDKFSKWEEFKVNQGVLNGDYIVFHSNGNIFTHSTYVNGKLHGEEKVNYFSGKLKKLNHYNHGARYGKSMEYFETGQILSESKIVDESPVESITYNNIGEITSQMFLKEGRTINQIIRNGKVFSEQISSNYDNFEAMKFYNEDGSLGMYFRMLDEEDRSYLIELDENDNEIKRIDVNKNPQELLKYQQYLKAF